MSESESSDSSGEEVDPLRVLEKVRGAEDSEGQACEIHMYQVRYDSRGERVCLQTGSRTELVWEKEPSHEAALVVTRFYSPLKELQITRLAIQSPYIKTALRDVVGSYPGTDINSNGPIYLFDEPRCLFHYHDELEAYAIAAKEENARRHVNFCLQYMAKILRAEISAYDSMMKNEAVTPGLEHRHLWMAFKPGALLYQRYEGHDIISRLREIQRLKIKDLPDVWIVVAERIECSGDSFGFVANNVTIANYDGYKPLTELDIFPLKYHVEQERIKDNLITRGRIYVSLCGIHHKLYEGPMGSSPENSSLPGSETRKQRSATVCWNPHHNQGQAK